MTPHLPNISIVTPSYNQAKFLDAPLQSILSQNDPQLAYVVIDGGSSDRSPKIIQKYADHLHFWCSEPDRGQYDAINKGFAKTTGEIMGWLNSDDTYTPWALQTIATIFMDCPQIEWLTTLYQTSIDSVGQPIRCQHIIGYNRSRFLRGENLRIPADSYTRSWTPPDWYSTSFIPQESTFWRRSLWEKAGGFVDDSLALAGDFELWARFYQHTDLYGVAIPLGAYRLHGDQKTTRHFADYMQEADRILQTYGGQQRPDHPLKTWVQSHLQPHLSPSIALRLGLAHQRHFCLYNNLEQKWIATTRWV